MLYAYGHHERSAATILSHFTSGVGVAFHKRHKTSRGQCRVFHRRTLGSDMAEVMPHSATTLHELHLFFVYFHYASVRIRITVKSDDKTIAQRTHLIIISNTWHRAALRHNIPEPSHEFEHFLLTHRRRITALNTCYFTGYAVMHVIGSLFKKISEWIFKGVLGHPYPRSQLVTVKIVQRSLLRLVVSVSFSFHEKQWFNYLCKSTYCCPNKQHHAVLSYQQFLFWETFRSSTTTITIDQQSITNTYR